MSHVGGTEFPDKNPWAGEPFLASSLWFQPLGVHMHWQQYGSPHAHVYMCVCLGEAFTSDVAPVFSFLTDKSADSGAGTILVLWPCDLGLNLTPLFAGL